MTAKPWRRRRPKKAEQEEFWNLSTRYGQALTAKYRAEADYREAKATLDAFYADHEGVVFRVFRPEDIDKAVEVTIQPILPDE